ncbi:unnamed protein product, partial [Scytosiphon promiscuus]
QVHSVRIKAGKATYSNRYMRTAKLTAEEEAGEAFEMKLGDLMSWGAIPRMMLHLLKIKLGVIPDLIGAGESTANTSLEFHAGRLLALSDRGLPYVIRMMCDGVIETIGQATFGGQMKSPFTPHPKKHPTTGKLHAFGNQFIDMRKPYVTYYVLDKNGKLERQFPIAGIERPLMMHDFAITENYAIFFDFPLLFKPDVLLRGKVPIVFDKTQRSRMGILRLNATDSSEMRWFDMPEPRTDHANILLSAVSRETPGSVRVCSNQLSSVIKIYTCDFSELGVDLCKFLEGLDPDALPFLHSTTLNLDTGEVKRASVLPASSRSCSTSMELPQVRRSLVGRKTRFGYCSAVGEGVRGFTSEMKVDLQAPTPETALVGRIVYGDGLVGGECIFIPSQQPGDAGGGGGVDLAGSTAGTEEDDGYLVTFVNRGDGTGNSG